jgi:hypothetical protein
MYKFVTLCFLAGLVFLPNSTSTADALPVTPSVTAVPTLSGKRVEQVAVNLKADLERQEAALMRYIKSMQSDHLRRNDRLKRLRFTLADLKLKLDNATQTYNNFDSQVVSQQNADRPLDVSFNRTTAMYERDMKALKEEKEFVDALLKYIRLKKC